MRNFIRVVAVAVGLSTLSFAAGVAGDLSLADPPNFGERVVLRLPPDLPADSARAAPLPPMLSTASAEASPLPRRRVTPLRAHVIAAEYLVNDGEELVLVSLPKPRQYWAADALTRIKAA